MPQLKNTFHLQIMDKETDGSFVKNGMTRHAENFRVGTNGGNDGVGTNIKGTEVVCDLTDGNTDFKCVGAEYNGSLNTIYFMLATTNGVISKVCEYRKDEGVGQSILHDTTSILNLQKNGYITGINEIDGLLFWSEWENNPRRINIERAKGYGLNGFTEDDIINAVKPPLDKLKITLELTDSEEENYIEEKMLYFSYQYRYLDGEYSTVAPFTEAAFFPKDFNYDFSEQSNRSMVNKFNSVLIDFNTGNERVTEIRLIFKESQNNTEWIIDDFNKEKLGWGHNETKQFAFTNNKRFKVLSDNIIRNYYNNVPLNVKAQTIIDGRLLYGHYRENFDIVDSEGEKIEIDYKLNLIASKNQVLNPDATTVTSTVTVTHVPNVATGELTLVRTGTFTWNDILDEITIISANNTGVYTVVSVTDTHLNLQKVSLPYPSYAGTSSTEIEFVQNKYIPSLSPKKTVKSIRDYEVGIVYSDDFGRSTIVLVSKTNTINIPIANSVTQNKIQVEIKNPPPAFATNYKFFIKPSKKEYDQILPTLFYEDGVFRWIKLEGADKDKIKEGDYLYVKADSQGVLQQPVKTKVLEITVQEKNFLEPPDVTDSVKEKAGLYFKIKPKNFRLDLVDFNSFYLEVFTGAGYYSFQSLASYIDDPHFYGDTLDDLTSSGSYTGATGERTRYVVQIDGLLAGGGGEDTFRWSDDNGANWNAENVVITGTPQLLNNGVSITFGSTTGHSLFDNWTINARAIFEHEGHSFGLFRTVKKHDEILTDIDEEKIYNGSRLTLIYTEAGANPLRKFEINNVSAGTYDNIQEWFEEENIFAEINSQIPEIDFDDIYFVRGILKRDGDVSYIEQDNTGVMTLAIRSVGTGITMVTQGITDFIQSGDSKTVILETEGKDEDPEIFFEIGKTYDIEDGVHKADLDLFPTDQHQTESLPLKVTLDWFNAFSYGNAVESYKIKDEFNRKGLETGIRTLSTIKEEYKQVVRKADITWSDVYEKEAGFNGLSTFNLSLINFTKLDDEEGSIQLLHNANGNLMVFQEDAIGIMPYNKNVIYDTQGGKVVGVSNNVLDRKSYAPYATGDYGTKNPESFVSRGNRKYIIDQSRGKLLRLSTDGITPISDKLFDHYFSRLMAANRNSRMVGGYDPRHGEYLFSIKNTSGVESFQESEIEPVTYSFKEKADGFPLVYTFDPDFILEADNDVYAWKNGVMHRLNATEDRNNFFGVQYSSVVKFFVNAEFSVEKIFKAMGIEGTHPWAVKLATKLTSREIAKTDFVKMEDYWFSDIMGNTNTNKGAQSSFGLGVFAIDNGIIETSNKYPSLSVGDHITSATLVFAPNKVINITETQIILENNISTVASFLIYNKNANIDGSDIRGDVMEVEMTSDETEKVELRAVNFQATKSNIS